MQLTLRRIPPPGVLALLVLAAGLALVSPARAEDRVTVRGAYYREPSTRVVQPMVEVTKDLPAGFDVGAHYLIDAITSASVAQGLVQDVVLTEKRNEARLSLGYTFGRTRIGGSVRHSGEPDYVSDTGALSLTHGVWENTGTVAVNLAYGRDYLRNSDNFKMKVYFAGLSYEQALTPTTLAQVGYDLAYLDGYQANQYLRHPSLGRENVPDKRIRHAFAARVAQYIPALTMGLQLHYRFYVDNGSRERTVNVGGVEQTMTVKPWGLTAHTIEGRVYKELGRDFEVRLSYRYHSQGGADFWCNSIPRDRGDPSCYGRFPAFHSVDVKFGPLSTHYAEAKLLWELRALASVPLLGWFAAGAADIGYGRFFQSTHYGQKGTPSATGASEPSRWAGAAHVLQLGYSLPF